MRSPRSVVCAPIGMPSRNLNCAMDLRALVTDGRWPVIAPRSRIAPSISLESRAASPTPMLTTTLVNAGNLHDVGVAELLAQRLARSRRGSAA